MKRKISKAESRRVADAALGRMVREMPVGAHLSHPRPNLFTYGEPPGFKPAGEGCMCAIVGSGRTPEEAIEDRRKQP
jgi:hypothetical protein